ncbi:MAG: hypothetical protein LBR11_06475 [Deltaproteobacteria bacterium]|jgi:hypothetical protein|nr:hypothetical protein [Deltaproteobacteria bacterium]
MPAPDLPPSPTLDTPAFWDIFLNARTILTERPKGLAMFLVTLELLRLAVSLIAARLMAPLVPIMNNFVAMAELDQEKAVTELMEAMTQGGLEALGLYLLGFTIPILLLPVVVLAFSRVALGLWDGYEPGVGDLTYAFRKYWPSVSICFFVSLYVIVAMFLFVGVSLPLLALSNLSRDPLVGGVLTMGGLVLSGLCFYRFFWPYFRRVCPLQVLPFFAFIDGKSQKLGVNRIFSHLVNFPRHLNLATGLIVLVSFIPILLAGVLMGVIMPDGALNKILSAVIQIFLDALLLWPLIGLAGFYRLCLYPPSPELANKVPDEVKDEDDDDDNDDEEESEK